MQCKLKEMMTNICQNKLPKHLNNENYREKYLNKQNYKLSKDWEMYIKHRIPSQAWKT